MQVYINIFFNYWGFIIFVGTNFQQKTKSLKICIIITQIHVIILRKPKYINFLKKNIISFIFQKSQDFNVA